MIDEAVQGIAFRICGVNREDMYEVISESGTSGKLFDHLIGCIPTK
jgi:hypothetical protein